MGSPRTDIITPEGRRTETERTVTLVLGAMAWPLLYVPITALVPDAVDSLWVRLAMSAVLGTTALALELVPWLRQRPVLAMGPALVTSSIGVFAFLYWNAFEPIYTLLAVISVMGIGVAAPSRAAHAIAGLVNTVCLATVALLVDAPAMNPWLVLFVVGNVELVVGVFQWQRDRQLRAERQRTRILRAMFEGSGDALLVVDDVSGATLLANRNAARLFGVSDPSELIGASRADLHGHLAETDRPSPREYSTVEGVVAGIVRCQRPDGTTVWSDYVYTRDEEAGLRYVRHADATQRLAHEQSLEDARNAAQAATRARDAFLAMMSHELRTPLHAVLGTTEVLLDEAAGGGDAERLGLIHRSAVHLLVRLDQILAYSTLNAGEVTVHPETVDLQCTLEEIVDLYRNTFTIPTVVSWGDGVPRHIRTDPLLLRRVLDALLSNAHIHGGGQIEIALAAHREGRQTRMEIRILDRGPGSAAAVEQHTRQAFAARADVGTRQGAGVHLGLALCASTLELMKGGLEIRDRPGGGLDVCVKFPAMAVHFERPASEGTSISGLNVLVVEDDPTNRMVAKAMLRRLGVSPAFAEDGLQGVEVARSGRFDLILMDLHMPGLSGWEAARRIRQELAEPPVILALTASLSRADHDAARQAGMQEILGKPVTLETLQGALERYAPKASGSSAA